MKNLRSFTRPSALSLLLFVLGPVLAIGQVPLQNFREASGLEHLREQFLSPPMDYAPHAFWFWNDALDEPVPARMAGEMSRKGMNPGYAHPRHIGSEEGLPVDQWFSEKYFDCFRGVLEECGKAGTLLGFCDDYWWPSARVGGKMVTEHPGTQARELHWSLTAKKGPWKIYLPPNEFIVACQHGERGIIREETLQLISTGETGLWEVPEGRWFLYVFTTVPSPTRNRGPDQILVNYMQEGLADKFIELGLKPYEDHLKEFMGGPLRYCFSDNEGEYGNVLPWSDYMVKVGRDLYGEDIRRFMPLLLTEDEEGTWVAARFKWFNLVSEIYANHFWKQMNDWLAERGLYYVSNFWEASLMLQAATVGDYFRVNRAFSLPGNDALGMGARRTIHFKEIQSICEFEQRPFMSEIMGVQGWGQTPAEMKIVANQATAWGVTQIVPHGISLDQDLKKALHPADWFEQNPYWETIGEWTDFCRRASYINSQGTLAANILVYNPMTSIWALSESFLTGRANRGTWDEPMARWINNVYYDVQTEMSRANIEYLIADDQYIMDSKLSADGAQLELHDHSFDTVIIPPLYAVQTKVYERLVAFARSGGKVILMGELPVASAETGLNDPAIGELNRAMLTGGSVMTFRDRATTSGDLCRQVVDTLDRPIISRNPAIILHTSHRVIDGNHFYWLSNNTEREVSGMVTFPMGSGQAQVWNCENGEIEPIYCQKGPDGNQVYLDWAPYEGYWLVFNAEESPLQDRIKLVGKTHALPVSDWMIGIEAETVPVSTASIWLGGDSSPKEPFDISPDEWTSQCVLAPLNPRGTWQADWISAPVEGPYGYFVHEFVLPDIPEYAFLNITADLGFKLYINGNEITGLPNSSDWKTVDTVDMLPCLNEGPNRIAVRTGKNINPTTFWMLAQGVVYVPGWDPVFIQTGSDWFMTDNGVPGWNTAGSRLDRISPAPVRRWNQLTWTGRSDVKPPASGVFGEEDTVWLKLDVPPGASSFSAGISLRDTSVWIDNHRVKADGQSIQLNGEASSIYLRATRSALDGWNQPGEFHIKGPDSRELADWTDWGMERYSGFVTYKTAFENDSPEDQEQVFLDLGEVNFVAQLWINGQFIGSRMWPPFRFDVTDALKDGTNSMTVRVGNLIANQMALHEDMNELETWGNPGRPDQSRFRGGFMGPVQLIYCSGTD